ncbi:MAG: DUF4249 family protein [Chitinophagales bacterium]
MKKWGVAAIILALFLSSCSTDFNVTTTWEDIGIVYGLLDASDTAQYIKVGKAYLDPSTSALLIAQNPDSLYYADLNVVLEEYSNGDLVNTIELEKVDGNMEGLVKDTGIFASSPNTLYKTKQSLNKDHDYTLVATEPDNGRQITASTKVVNDFIVIIPTPTIKINFLPGLNYKVTWTSAKDGKIYDLTIRFHYTEISIADPSIQVKKYIDWLVFSNYRTTSTSGGTNETYDIPNDNLYTFLGNFIPDDQTITRKMDSCDFMFSVGGEELDTYNQVYIAQQGLTSGQVLPTYTNIDNGLGLFSSRFHKTIANIQIDARTIDSIACNTFTSHLNFLEPDGTLCH